MIIKCNACDFIWNKTCWKNNFSGGNSFITEAHDSFCYGPTGLALFPFIVDLLLVKVVAALLFLCSLPLPLESKVECHLVFQKKTSPWVGNWVSIKPKTLHPIHKLLVPILRKRIFQFLWILSHTNSGALLSELSWWWIPCCSVELMVLEQCYNTHTFSGSNNSLLNPGHK